MAKYTSKGTQLQLNIASVYTTIVQMMDIDGPDAEVQMMATTALDSPTGMEHKPNSYAEGGVVSGTLFFDPQAATHKLLAERIAAPPSPSNIDQWKQIWSDVGATVWPFNGTLTKFTPNGKVGEALQAKFAIQLDGVPVYP